MNPGETTEWVAVEEFRKDLGDGRVREGLVLRRLRLPLHGGIGRKPVADWGTGMSTRAGGVCYRRPFGTRAAAVKFARTMPYTVGA